MPNACGTIPLPESESVFAGASRRRDLVKPPIGSRKRKALASLYAAVLLAFATLIGPLLSLLFSKAFARFDDDTC